MALIEKPIEMAGIQEARDWQMHESGWLYSLRDFLVVQQRKCSLRFTVMSQDQCVKSKNNVTERRSLGQVYLKVTTPKRSTPWLSKMIFPYQLNCLRKTVEKYSKRGSRLFDWLEGNIPEGLTVFSFPEDHRRRIRTVNSLERVCLEIRRRTRVARIFPNETSCLSWSVPCWWRLAKLGRQARFIYRLKCTELHEHWVTWPILQKRCCMILHAHILYNLRKPLR